MCSFMTLQHPSSQYYVQNILEEYQNYDWFFMACEPEALFWDKLYIERVDVGGGLSTSQWKGSKCCVCVMKEAENKHVVICSHIWNGHRKEKDLRNSRKEGKRLYKPISNPHYNLLTTSFCALFKLHSAQCSISHMCAVRSMSADITSYLLKNWLFSQGGGRLQIPLLKQLTNKLLYWTEGS